MRHGHMTCTILYKNGTISTPCSAMSKYFVKHCCNASGPMSTLEDKCNHLSQNKITFSVSTVKISREIRICWRKTRGNAVVVIKCGKPIL